MKLSEKSVRLGLLSGAFLFLVLGFRTMLFDHLPAVFNTPAEDLSFAWYVPLFSLYVLWTERDRLVRSLGAPSAWPLLGLLPVLFLGLLGVRGVQVRFELLSFIGLLILLPWAFFGRKTAKRGLFPALFLLFCMPMASYLQPVTSPLRLFVTSIASGLLSGFGLEVVRQGTMIQVLGVCQANGDPFVLGVADPCSGLRSIYALLALSAGYGYFSQPTWVRRGLLFVLAVPLAILGNVLRIMAICIAGKAADPAFAMGPVHDTMGFVVFALALGLLVAAGGLLDRLFRRPEASSAEGESETAAVPAGHRSWIVPAAVLALLVPSMLFQTLTPAPFVTEAPDATLPEELMVAGLRFTGDPVEPSVGETNLLVGAVLSKRAYVAAPELAAYRAAKDALERDYGSEDAALQKLMEAVSRRDPSAKAIEAAILPMRQRVLFRVSTVVSGANKSSLHRPELCLPSQGFSMGPFRTLRIGDVDWHVIELLDGSDRCCSLFAYTFINQEGYRTDSHEARIWRDVWDRSVYNRVDRWVMTSVQLFRNDERLLRSVLEPLKGVGE